MCQRLLQRFPPSTNLWRRGEEWRYLQSLASPYIALRRRGDVMRHVATSFPVYRMTTSRDQHQQPYWRQKGRRHILPLEMGKLATRGKKRPPYETIGAFFVVGIGMRVCGNRKNLIYTHYYYGMRMLDSKWKIMIYNFVIAEGIP